MNSLQDVEEIKDLSRSRGPDAFKIYRLLNGRKPAKKAASGRKACGNGRNLGGESSSDDEGGEGVSVEGQSSRQGSFTSKR